MNIPEPFHLKQWVEEHRDLLRPPVGNEQVYRGNDDYIVMVVGGPNARKDFHYNEGEELFYQLEGDITLKIIEDGQPRDIVIREGEMFLLPGGVPHSPRRPANTVGLVVEMYRRKGQHDGFMWFCENCHHKLYEDYIEVSDIVEELPLVMNRFMSSRELRTCDNCGTVMEVPRPKVES